MVIDKRTIQQKAFLDALSTLGTLDVLVGNNKVDINDFMNNINNYTTWGGVARAQTPIIIVQAPTVEGDNYIANHPGFRDYLCAIVDAGVVSQYWLRSDLDVATPVNLQDAVKTIKTLKAENNIDWPFEWTGEYAIPGTPAGNSIAYFRYPFRVASTIEITRYSLIGSVIRGLKKVEQYWGSVGKEHENARALRRLLKPTQGVRVLTLKNYKEIEHNNIKYRITPFGTLVEYEGKLFDMFSYYMVTENKPFRYAVQHYQRLLNVEVVNINNIPWSDKELKWWLQHDLKAPLPINIQNIKGTDYIVFNSDRKVTINQFINPDTLWAKMLATGKVLQNLPGKKELKRALELAIRWPEK